jgi:hypothetical protein
LGLFILSNSLLFISSLLLSLFLYIISFFSGKKESCFLFNSIIYRHFWYWTHFLKTSGGSNFFGGSFRAIFGGTVPKQVIISLVPEMEKKCSGTLLRLRGQIPVDSKALTPTPNEATLLQANPMRRAMRYRVILQAAALFLK